MAKCDPILWNGGETCPGFMWSLGNVLRRVLCLPLQICAEDTVRAMSEWSGNRGLAHEECTWVCAWDTG